MSEHVTKRTEHKKIRNHKMFLFLLSVFFFPEPWYTVPPQNATIRRYLCKGFTCETNDFLPHQCDEFDDMIESYSQEKFPEGLVEKMELYIERGFYPAYCSSGFFSLVGMAGYKQNLTASFEFLRKGTELNLWACYDILSFHPFMQNSQNHREIAASKGGVWSMISFALTNPNRTMALETLIHVATAATPGWWKKRRSGKEYAESVSSILNMNGKSKEKAWEKLKALANSGNLPSAIWVADGYRTGEIGEQNAEKGIEVLLPFISTGPWKVDLSNLLEAKDVADKEKILDIAIRTGQSSAKAIKSYAKYLL